MSSKEPFRKMKVLIPEDTYNNLVEMAEALGVTSEELSMKILDVISSYKNIVLELGQRLKVKKEHKIDSIFEELVYYGVETWRGILEPLLRRLRASGRFELETLQFDPSGPAIEIELVALEGSDLLADEIRLYWTLKGITMEIIYYLEEGMEPPRIIKADIPWDYLPDEHAIVITFQASSIDKLPPIYAIDRKVESFL